MTRSEKLDKILYALLFIDKKVLAEENISKKITINFLCENLKLDCENWEMISLKNELFNDQYIIEENEELRITESGKKFITKEKGYSHIDKIKNQNELILTKTIEKFRYDKIALFVAIISLIIAILALLNGQN